MLILIWIITSIIVFSVIVLVHEYGHFKSARIFWVKVEEFWLGIPPKAKTLFTDKLWTKYTLNYLPLWGFVKLKWENINTFFLFDENKKSYNNETLEKAIISWKKIFDNDWNLLNKNELEEILLKLKENYAKDSILTKPYYAQAIIILAWVFMNFVLAIVIFSFLFFIWVKPIWINDQIKTSTDLKLIPTYEKALEIWLIKQNSWAYLVPAKNSIAEKSNIKPNDLLLKINSTEINSIDEVKSIISNSKNITLNFEIKRTKNNCDISKEKNCEFENISLKITPNTEWKIWSYLIPNNEINKDFNYKYWLFDSIKYACIETYGQIKLTFKWISILAKKIFTPETPRERQEAIEQVSGPIWIVDFMTKSVWNGIIFILIIWALISINLWVFNLLPIPALDGWRFLFILINWSLQKIFWKKAISEQIEWYIHVWFFILLIFLSILIAYNDIIKIFKN